MSCEFKPAASQLKLGLKLYASHWSGTAACTPSANSFAWLRIGFLVSIHNKSACGANAIALLTAHCVPPWYL